MTRSTTINLLPVKALIKLKQGADVTLRLRWTSGGVAVDLSGYTGRAYFSETPDDTNPLFTLSTETTGMTLDSSGNITLTIPSATTSALEIYAGVFDLELENPAHKIKCLIDGTWVISREVKHG
jgi:hypothetical protein